MILCIKKAITYHFQVYAMLKRWKSREGSLAQSTVLAQALRECRMDDAAAML